jgi:hypothetical protein
VGVRLNYNPAEGRNRTRETLEVRKNETGFPQFPLVFHFGNLGNLEYRRGSFGWPEFPAKFPYLLFVIKDLGIKFPSFLIIWVETGKLCQER